MADRMDDEDDDDYMDEENEDRKEWLNIVTHKYWKFQFSLA
jgi:hypothetical protein